MKFWKVWAIIRTKETVYDPLLLVRVEYDTFIDFYSVPVASRETALQCAEVYLYKRYGIDADVILVGATRERC